MEITGKEFDTLYQLSIDEAIQTGEIDAAKIMSTLNISKDTATAILKKMSDTGLITTSAANAEAFAPIDDSLYEEVLVWTKKQEQLTISDIQRAFKLGWIRSRRILLTLEREGVVSAAELGDLTEKRIVL